MTKRL
jgi:hypothetical protein